MYAPKPFNQKDKDAIYELVRAYPFATLVSAEEASPVITHIPLQLHQKNTGDMVLHGHLAKANPHSRVLIDGAKVTAIFMGPHAYISSSWYSHVNVPTWNYAAVHVCGTLSLLSRGDTLQALAALTKHFEHTQEKPFDLSQMPEAMLDAYLNELVAFEISIDDLQASWKLSQNRNERDFQRIVAELENLKDDNARGVAGMMKNTRE